MSGALYWRSADWKVAQSYSGKLCEILVENDMDSLGSSDLDWLRGLDDAGVEGAGMLVSLVEEHECIEVRVVS